MSNQAEFTTMGRLTRDPEVKYLPSGAAVCDVSIASNRKWKDKNEQQQESTTFLDVTFFGRGAETIAKYMTKGSGIWARGRIENESWEDKATGQKRHKMKFTGEEFKFLGGGTEKPADRPAQAQARPARASAPVDDWSEGEEPPF